MKDLLGLGKTEQERIYNQLNQQYGNVSAGVTGWRKDLNDAANFGGMIFGMAGTGAPLKLTGMSANLANKVNTIASFWDAEKDKAAMKYPGDETKQNISAGFNTMLYSLAGDAFPAGKIRDVISKAQPEMRNILANLSEKATAEEMKQTLLGLTGKVIKGVAKGSAEMLALTKASQQFDKILGLSGEAYDAAQPHHEDMDVLKSMAIGLIAPKALEVFGGRKAVSNSLYDIASNPIRFRDMLELNQGNLSTQELNKKIGGC